MAKKAVQVLNRRSRLAQRGERLKLQIVKLKSLIENPRRARPNTDDYKVKLADCEEVLDAIGPYVIAENAAEGD